MTPADHDYYAKRIEVCRQHIAQATDPGVRMTHQAMLRHYEARLRGASKTVAPPAIDR